MCQGALLLLGFIGCNAPSSSVETGRTQAALAADPNASAPQPVGQGAFGQFEAPPPANLVAPAGVTRAPILSASQHPGHLADKVVKKPSPSAQAAAAPAAVDPDVIRKQSAYLQQWEAMRPSVAGLPTAEQERRRADLKRQVMGY
jgi:hypothetical protein